MTTAGKTGVKRRVGKTRDGAFTLLELLCVLGVIGILSALLFPAVAASRRASERAKTKVVFHQWVGAIEAFRREYGYYPVFDATHLVNASANATEHLFHDLLAARQRDGSPLASTNAALTQNRKRIAFHLFSDSEIDDAGRVCDASGAVAIAVLVDRDLDGVIKVGNDFAALPSVAGLTPGEEVFPSTGVRAGAVFYSPAPGATAVKPAFVTSWK